ncbi:hypothetical protein [uncultured Kordia sp.]|uniref:hypothetical protein n=1 Tax=uncultured Kordia sp. TaxID=507699 RepID=UPI002614CB90|nr:hypothetical protein [uncultured Kordia sp.]
MRMVCMFVLLASICGYSQQKTQLPKDSLALLDGLMLRYNTIEKLSDSTSTFFDKKPIPVQRFKINSNIRVQTSCNLTGGTFDTVTANYLLEIAIDDDNSLRKKFVDAIYKYWVEKDEKYIERYKNSSEKLHLYYANGDYVLYKKPLSNNVGAYYTFYFKNKIMKVSFVGFDTKSGFGGLSSFLNELVQFRFERNQINPKYEMKFDPKLFMKLYKENAFAVKTTKK